MTAGVDFFLLAKVEKRNIFVLVARYYKLRGVTVQTAFYGQLQPV